MNGLTLMLALAVQAISPVPNAAMHQPVTAPAAGSHAAVLMPALPEDWSALPDLKLRRRPLRTEALSSYVRDEVRSGRCAATANHLRVELAVLVAANGQLRRIRPQAIGCPTVEQYASGVMLRMARSNVAPSGEDRWFRTQLVFRWQ
ncbi:hypothetical protein SPHI_04830 [Sphingomonas jeddahensis]|uniref:Gram-negative bacterial tonB protein n=2 Tax=Sphingomonas jeddahensis TaxID=1915074 RepID=A0A1V2EXM7_9SPHN|nr:hypothetical protein SPHI_04830 [Sphingomonas jeddahensis]